MSEGTEGSVENKHRWLDGLLTITITTWLKTGNVSNKLTSASCSCLSTISLKSFPLLCSETIQSMEKNEMYEILSRSIERIRIKSNNYTHRNTIPVFFYHGFEWRMWNDGMGEHLIQHSIVELGLRAKLTWWSYLQLSRAIEITIKQLRNSRCLSNWPQIILWFQCVNKK